MAGLISAPSSRDTVRTGVMVAMSESGPKLCPFFARCDGLVVFSADAPTEILSADPSSSPSSMCELIEKSGVQRLICGFIAEPCRTRLRARGVDIRLGSCRETIAVLAARFDTLPAA